MTIKFNNGIYLSHRFRAGCPEAKQVVAASVPLAEVPGWGRSASRAKKRRPFPFGHEDVFKCHSVKFCSRALTKLVQNPNAHPLMDYSTVSCPLPSSPLGIVHRDGDHKNGLKPATFAPLQLPSVDRFWKNTGLTNPTPGCTAGGQSRHLRKLCTPGTAFSRCRHVWPLR